MAPEFGFAGKPGESRMSPGRVHHAERLKVAAVRVYDLPVTLKLKPRHFSREEFRAEILSLACHVRGELLPVRLHDTGIIHDLCRDGDLTADLFLFKDKNAETSTCQINSGGESCRTSADYYGIVGFNFCQDAISH